MDAGHPERRDDLSVRLRLDDRAAVRGHRLIHHPGGMPGFRSDIARFVDDDLTIIVLMNLDDVDIGSIVNGLAQLYLPAPPG